MPADLPSLLRLEVPLIVQLGARSMAVEELLRLGPGSIIELPKRSDEELEILVNNRQVGHGTAVKIGENFGIRVTAMGDARQRVSAIGRAAAPPAAATADADLDAASDPPPEAHSGGAAA